MNRLLTLEVLKESLAGGRLLTVVVDDSARARNDLAGSAFLVDLAQTNPLTELLGVGDLKKIDAVLGAKGLDKLGVRGLVAVGCQDAEMGLKHEVGRD